MLGIKFKKRKIPKSKKEEDYKNKDLEKLSNSQILIKVYKHFGSNTSFLKIQYFAEERRDMYNNLISINEKYNHNEDTDFTIDDVYREMEIILDFKNLGKDERIKILDKKIEFQDKLIKYLDIHPQLNAIYNYADESLKTRDYKILRNYIKYHDNNGAYFTIENGLRVYSFESIDGFLVPIWHGVDTYTKNPDHTRKVKINIQEDQRARQELAMFNKDKKVAQVMLITIILCIILCFGFMFGLYKVFEKSQSLDEKLQAQSFSCSKSTAEIVESLNKFVQNDLVKQAIVKNQATPTQSGNIIPLNPENVINEIT